MKQYFNSPLGYLELTATGEYLRQIRFLEGEPEQPLQKENEILNQAKAELSEYFEGERTAFSVPFEAKGTDFQQSVWKELLNIPYGQTITYGELAQKLGAPNKVRAIGNANGSNPIPLIIPCHRVIGVDNKLVGYAGGIHRKQFLLKLEGAILL